MREKKKLQIVILESDPVVLDILKSQLLSKGHNVVVFYDPTICPIFKISHCECQKDSPCADVLIADVGMPNMGGIDLFEKQMQQGCKVSVENKLLLGDSVTPEQQAIIDDLGCHFIQKPFNTFEILDWIDKCTKTPLGDQSLNYP